MAFAETGPLRKGPLASGARALHPWPRGGTQVRAALRALAPACTRRADRYAAGAR